MEMSWPLLLIVVVALVPYKSHAMAKQLPLPPGPRGLPFFGNTLQIPAEFCWLTFIQWAKIYGEIMYLNVLGKPFIILNTREAITELLEKRGAIYSDRPVMPMAGELAGHARYAELMPYCQRQKDARKLLMNQRKAPILHEIEEAKVVQLMTRILQTPLELRMHIRWFIASLVLQISHGVTVDSADDPLVRKMRKVMEDFSGLAMPGTYLVDSFPFLMHVPEWMPGAGFKKIARDARELTVEVQNGLYDGVKEKLARGAALPSFTADLIQGDPSPTPEEEELYRTASLVFYFGASDTTVAAMDTFFVIMAQNPNVQRKAQAEVDALTGGVRLPKVSDKKDLPYLDAALKESLRVYPVAPIALPHSVMEGDEYAGYRIPRGASIVANTWAIMHDPSIYPNPHEVIPERHLGEKPDPDPRLFAYGYGRRVCPGQVLAGDTLFIVAATALALFDFSDARSLDGSPMKYEGKGIITHPHPFKCIIKS